MSVDSGVDDSVDGSVDDLAAAVDHEVLVELAQAVWASFVDPEVPLVDLGPWAPEPDGSDVVVGSVRIDGPTPGALTVTLPAPAAVDAAARMFAIDVAAVAPADVHDAVGEITNMVGGNVKALLSGEHRLGLPSVTEVAAPHPDEASASVTLLWGEHTVLVTLDRAAGGSTS